MIFVSDAVLMNHALTNTLEWPVFLWQNMVQLSGIVASAADANYPATNLWNAQTSSVWKAGTAVPVTLDFDVTPTEEIDAIGFARHNFGTGAMAIKIEGLTGDDGAVLETLTEFTPGDDHVILAIFEGAFYVHFKISITSTTTVQPQCAVVSIGTLLRMSTGIPVGHMPIKDSLKTTMLTGIAENGDFLDDIITMQQLATTVAFQLLGPDWYRENMRPFVQAMNPFFFGWAPMLYPDEMAYAKFSASAMPMINQGTGEMDISLPIVGLAY